MHGILIAITNKILGGTTTNAILSVCSYEIVFIIKTAAPISGTLVSIIIDFFFMHTHTYIRTHTRNRIDL